MTEMTEGVASGNPEQQRAGYQPPDPIQVAPLFVWPPRPVALLKWMFGFPGYLWPWLSVFVGISAVTWLFLTPDLAKMKTFSADWIAFIFFRDALLLILTVSAFYVPLYVLKTQGTRYKHSTRWPAKDNPRFLFGSQLWDNVFWTFGSALPIATTYQVVGLWMQTNSYAPVVSWQDHPVYCVLLLLFIPVFAEVHFWAIHRLLHWPPMYRSVHYIHHKNDVNVNPWSGIAMHPIEHLLFFSGPAIFLLIIPSHPLHLIFYVQYLLFSSSLSHIGFHKIVLPGKFEVSSDNYMHYLHHKYFEVNYAASEIFPIDKWRGTFHDGTAQSMESLMKRRRAQSTSAIG